MKLPSYSMSYSLSCGVHAVAASDRFWAMKSLEGNYSQNDALKIFLGEEHGPQKIVDDCEGFVCNK